jgi:hypothetical protein
MRIYLTLILSLLTLAAAPVDAQAEQWWQGGEPSTRSAIDEPSTPLETVLGSGADQAWQAFPQPGDGTVSVTEDPQLDAPVASRLSKYCRLASTRSSSKIRNGVR